LSSGFEAFICDYTSDVVAFCVYKATTQNFKTIMKEKKISVKKNKINKPISLGKDLGKKMDEFEAKMVENYELLVLPLVHRFTDGLYVREIAINKGTLLTSKTHLTQHQFFLLKGKISVWDNEGNEQYLEAPYIGITQANTRRIAYAWEDCIWATCHPNPTNEILEELEEIIFEDYQNSLLSDDMKKKIKVAQEKSQSNSLIIDSHEKIKSIDNNKNRKICQQ
jgi:hypothetical protein